MDYKKAYKEALERAKSKLHYPNHPCFVDVTEIFPELKESEDKRIRKWIINEIKVKHHNLDEENVDFVDKAIDWLEKQADTYTKKDVDDAWLKGTCDAKQELEKQGEQKPIWSEEDEKMRKKLLFLMEEENSTEAWEGCYEWLKSLKDRLKGE